MSSSAVRTLILAFASSALIAAPAVAQGAMPAGADATLAQEAAEEAAEEAASGGGGPADAGDPSADPCEDTASDAIEDALPVAAEDDPCKEASASETDTGATSSSARDRAAGSKGSAKPISLSIPLILRRGYATVGAVTPSSAGVVVQKLTVAGKGKAKARPIARVRRVVSRSGRLTLRIAVSKPGRKVLRSARTTLNATLRTTITLRSGRSTTSRRAVLLVPGRRR